MLCGNPIVVINPIPGQEEENAEFLEKNGLAVSIKKEDEVTKKLQEIIYDDDKLESIRRNIQAYAKPYAAKDICNKIFENLD